MRCSLPKTIALWHSSPLEVIVREIWKIQVVKATQEFMNEKSIFLLLVPFQNVVATQDKIRAEFLRRCVGSDLKRAFGEIWSREML